MNTYEHINIHVTAFLKTNCCTRESLRLGTTPLAYLNAQTYV